MLPGDLLTPTHLLQTMTLAISVFNLLAFLWLALTVWLNGNRRAGITRLGVVGLGLSSLFFSIHAVLISSPLATSGGYAGMVNNPSTTFLDVLWHLLWLPALIVPYIWFAIGLHYAALINVRWRRRRPGLLVSSAILGCLVLLLLVSTPSTVTFVGTLRLLACGDVDPRFIVGSTHSELLWSLVVLPALFLCYVTFCAIGPWLTPGRVGRLLIVASRCIVEAWNVSVMNRIHRAPEMDVQLRFTPSKGDGKTPSLLHALADAFWDDPADAELLEEPILSWHLARPVLLLGALLMVGLTTTLGMLGVRSILDWLAIVQHHPLSVPPAIDSIPLNLMVLDLFAVGAVALIILLIGYSIMRHGVLIERPLARRGFLQQWRGIVIVATTVAIFISLLVSLLHIVGTAGGADGGGGTLVVALGGMLLIAALATVAYAMFTWSSYTAHDRYIALLGPFLRGTGLHHWLNTDLQKTEQGLQDLFIHLCQDALAVQFARLTVIAGSLRRSFNYRWPENALSILPGEYIRRAGEGESIGPETAGGTGDGGLVPALKGGDRAPDTSALYRGRLRGTVWPVSVPHRLRMTLDGRSVICWVLPMYDERGLMATLYLGPRQDGGAFTDEDMDLAYACGQRILDTLGDHEAMQAVAGLLRRRIGDVKLLGAQQRRVLHDEILPQMHLALLRLETLRSQTDGAALTEAIEMISDAHRRLAAMMRAIAPGAPHRLERDGLMNAIRTMLEQDFQYAFDEVQWYVSDETAARIDEIVPPAIAELIFAAIQEALRNAARHGRGIDLHRRLCLTLKASCDPDLEVIVDDDGVGIAQASSSTTGTGGGLLTHSALLAIAGGSLTIKGAPGKGVSVRIVLPAEALR